MSESSSNLTSLLSEVAKKTSQYAWLEAVGLYEKALAVTGEMLEKARIASEIGRSYFQFAFQSDSRGEFKELKVKAKSAYDSASSLYGSDPKSGLVRGKILYASLWEADDYEERKALLKCRWISRFERGSSGIRRCEERCSDLSLRGSCSGARS